MNPQTGYGNAPQIKNKKAASPCMRDGSLVFVGRTGIEPATR